MKTYARIQDGVFFERIDPVPYDDEAPDWQPGDPSRIGTEKPIEIRYHPDLVATMVDITGIVPEPQLGWLYSGGVFTDPATILPTPEEILAANRAEQVSRSTQASIAMTPVLVSLNLGDATDAETVVARAWQDYYRALQAVDLTAIDPQWPAYPQ